MRFLILFIALSLVLLVPASAQENNTTIIEVPKDITVTFSDLNVLQKDMKILVYDNAGNFVGEYNTTDTVTLDGNHSYIFVFKPSGGDWFSNPFNAIELVKEGAPTILGLLLFGVTIGGLVYLITRLVVG